MSASHKIVTGQDWDETMCRQASEPFIDPAKVVENCEHLARQFRAWAKKDAAAGKHENAARLRREAKEHLRFADGFRESEMTNDEAA